MSMTFLTSRLHFVLARLPMHFNSPVCWVHVIRFPFPVSSHATSYSLVSLFPCCDFLRTYFPYFLHSISSSLILHSPFRVLLLFHFLLLSFYHYSFMELLLRPRTFFALSYSFPSSFFLLPFPLAYN